jgi:hypothetical protein
MAYNISTTDSQSNVTFVIPDNTIDTTSLPIALVGPNSSNFGDDLNRNSIRLLENFASTTSPTAQGYTNTLIGQLWYDKSTNLLKVYKDTDGDGYGDTWLSLEPYVSATAPVSKKQGELWFNTSNKKLYIHDGSQFVDASSQQTEVVNTFSNDSLVANPTLFGTKLRTIFLKDVTGKSHAVLGLVHVNNSTSNNSYAGSTNGETLMAILNHDEAFTVGNVPSNTFGEDINFYQELSAVNGIGVSIKKGLNLRQEYTQGAVPLADEATTAQTANAIYSTSLTVALTTDDDLYHDRKDVVPDTTNLYKLGDNTKLWNLGYINQLYVGSGAGAGGILPTNANGAGLTIGNSGLGNSFAELHVIDATANGNVFVGNASSNGSITVYNGVNTRNITANGESSFGIISNVSITGGVNNQSIVTDGSANLSWATRLSEVTINAGSGLADGGSITASGTTTTGAVTLNIGQGYGISVATNEIAINNTHVRYQANLEIAASTTDDLSEGLTNLYFTAARANAVIADVFESNVTLQESLNVGEDLTVGNDLTITGDLFVNGTQTILNTATLDVEDINITVGNAATTSSAANGAGLTFGNWSSGTTPTLTWSHGSTRLQVNKPFYASGGFIGNLTGDITGDVTGDITGSVTGTVSSLSNHTTSNLAEGTNQYFTNSRADARADVRIAAADITDLNNVNTGTPNDGQALLWNGATNKWEANTLPTGVTTLVNLTDVHASGSTTGQVLQKLGNGDFGFGTVSADNFYLDGLSFNTGTGVLTASVNGTSNQTVDLDGRYIQGSSLVGGSGISVSGTTITNDAPDQTVSLTGAGATTVTGTYPNFTITSTDTNTSDNYYLDGLSWNSSTGVLTASVNGTTNQTVDLDGRYLQSESYTGTVTSVVAGTGLNGGTITSTGTISMPNKGPGAGSYGSGVSSISVDAQGRVTSISHNAGYTSNSGDITSVSAGTGLTGGGTSGAVTLNVSTGAVTNGATTIPTGDQVYDFVVGQGYTSNNGDITAVTAGGGLSGGGSSGAVTLTVNSDLRGVTSSFGGSSSDYIAVGGTTIDFYLDGALDMRLENDGDLHVDGDVVAFSGTTSDSRLKTNVTPIESALDKISKMRGVEFDWTATNRKGQHDIGVIAQEVEDVIPELVRDKQLNTGEFEGKEETYKVVDYDKISAVLIEAVKEQQEIIKDLQQQIDELKDGNTK